MGSGIDTPLDVLLLIDLRTFGNVWYWVMTVVAWSVTCHWTLGVPHDSVVRADHRGGADAAQVESMAQANAARIAGIIGSAGVILVSVVAFFLAALGTIAFGSGLEFAQGMFLLLSPLAVVAVANAALALRVARTRLAGAALRRALIRRRFFNQVIGLTGISVAACVGAFHIVRELILPW